MKKGVFMKEYLLEGLPQPRMFALNRRAQRDFGEKEYAFWSGKYEGVVVSSKKLAEQLKEEEEGVIEFTIKEVNDA